MKSKTNNEGWGFGRYLNNSPVDFDSQINFNYNISKPNAYSFLLTHFADDSKSQNTVQVKFHAPVK